MNQRLPADVGTELESLDAIRMRYGDAVFTASAGSGREGTNPDTSLEAVPGKGVEQPFRPTARPSTPRLTLLDDGEDVAGEMVRLRVPITVIGRTEGDILIPHDGLISKRHAEVIREKHGSQFQWLLRDLESANHTFVSCSSSLLQPGRLLIIGRYRFRFENPLSQAAVLDNVNLTRLADVPRDHVALWPSLVATNPVEGDRAIALCGVSLTLGQPGVGNDIELDDPCIAPRHAVITRQPSGQWQIKALPSRNGVWVQIKAVRLTSLCRFMCGEQQFLFCNR